MSERIYTFLLRFFPPAFRRQYQDESLQLFRERLRDERGLFQRLRLTLDLIVDIFGALPLAYRNSYAHASTPASLAPQFDGVPAFRTLPTEPIRREVILVASLTAVIALAAFPIVLSRANSYRSPEPGGRKSAIESAIESANQPISPDSTPIPRTFDATSPNNGQPTAGPAFTAGKARAGESAASSSDSYSAIAVISSATNVPAPSRTPVMVNLSGRWSGTSTGAAATDDMPQAFVFSQDSVRLTGAALSAATGRTPIIHGVVDGNSVSFELASGETSFRYDLRIDDQALRGALSIRNKSGVQSALVSLKRVR